MIYLDNNATTQVAPEVFEAMRPFLNELYGNPSSAHTFGRKMRHAVERAREQVAALLGASDSGEIVFTSCGSESDNWAIRGALKQNPEKRHIVTTRVEHEAVRNLCEHLEQNGYEVTWLGVDEEGQLDLESLSAALRHDTALVSVMLANNETGVLFPIAEIGRMVHERSAALFHVDGVQAVGKIPIDLSKGEVDLFALSGHKFHAPKGVGALYIRSGVKLPSFIIGGGQERGRRAGTEAVALMAGFGAAAEAAGAESADSSRMSRLRAWLEADLRTISPEVEIFGAGAERLPNTTCFGLRGVRAETAVIALDLAGVAVSSGSACSSGKVSESHVLRAMGVAPELMRSAIRVSLGWSSRDSDVERFLEAWRSFSAKLATERKHSGVPVPA